MEPSRTISMRVTTEEYEMLKAIAEAEGLSMSELIRRLYREAVAREERMIGPYAEEIAKLKAEQAALKAEQAALRAEKQAYIERERLDLVEDFGTGDTERIHLNMTAAKKAYIRDKAAALGTSMTKFILARCVYNVPDLSPIIPGEKVDEMYEGLVREGKELNRITERANRLARTMRIGDFYEDEIEEEARSITRDIPGVLERLLREYDALESALSEAEDVRRRNAAEGEGA
jgi:uncharacterized protein (DUF1778 family)